MWSVPITSPDSYPGSWENAQPTVVFRILNCPQALNLGPTRMRQHMVINPGHRSAVTIRFAADERIVKYFL